MTPDVDRLAMLEERIRQLEGEGRSRPEEVRDGWQRRPRRTLLVVGLALVLLVTPAIALAAHQFADVPNSNPFHNDIAALANSGVTIGCGGGNYCPKAVVTREQMAAFLNRLGALAPDKPPVVNADRVDGRHANQLVRVARGSTSGTPTLSTSETVYGSVAITAPADGFVLVTATPTVSGIGCVESCFFYHRIRHVEAGVNSQYAIDGAGAAPTYLGAAPLTWVFPVSAGTHTFESRLILPGVSGTLYGWYNALTALYIPFGGTGGGTLAFDEVPLAEPKAMSSE